LAVVKKLYGAESVIHAAALIALGMNLLAQKKWTEAEPLLRDGLALQDRLQPNAWTTFHTRSQLGGALLA
jgi:hypothetical protein